MKGKSLLFLIMISACIVPSSAYLNFLQDVESNQKTSLGVVGEGLLLASKDISSLSSTLTESFKVIGNQINTSLKLVSSLGGALIKSQIINVKSELADLQNTIISLEGQLATAKSCSDYATCTGCSSESTCVWCKTLKICVSGNEKGANNLECSDFEYGQCSISGCEIYANCNNCIGDLQCKWCDNGKFCSADPKECEPELVYSLKEQPDCPIDKNPGKASDTFVSKSHSKKTLQEIEGDLQELYKLRSKLQIIIKGLEESLENFSNKVKDALKDEFDGILVENSLKGIKGDVDILMLKETEENREFQEELAMETKGNTVEGVALSVKEETNTLATKVDDSFTMVQEDIKEMKKKLDEELELVKESIKTIKDQVKSAEAAAEKAEAARITKAEADKKAAEEAAKNQQA